ncbi:toxin-antitoxin system YwqK family antitoxin [Winogradskyella immobilis]|uniref:Uncharacterized protein n=1 Tax=Winogradskyella immobilis TaxID=2816852 RepID=A0ABS8EKR1_9FLAO|nr:hypothetical protein [Winogradskyella immobilis]MCC1483427.1 hypothetical protein [Winogradskyella immobilis]MCG0015521.1 hypothetical protein [Winogradskyella immobilis]
MKKHYTLLVLLLGLFTATYSQSGCSFEMSIDYELGRDGDDSSPAPKQWTLVDGNNNTPFNFLSYNYYVKDYYGLGETGDEVLYKMEIENLSNFDVFIKLKWSNERSTGAITLKAGSTYTTENLYENTANNASLEVKSIRLAFNADHRREFGSARPRDLKCGEDINAFLDELRAKQSESGEPINNDNTIAQSENLNTTESNTQNTATSLNTSEQKPQETRLPSESIYQKRQREANERAEKQRLAEEKRLKDGQDFINQQNREIAEYNQSVDKLGDELSSELTQLFSGSDNAALNVLNVTESIMASGLIESIDGLTAVGIGGGALAIGAGLLQAAKQKKAQAIKDNSSNIKTKVDEMRATYTTFESAIKEKDNIKVLKTHNDLSVIESSIIESANFIIDKKGSVEGLGKLKTTISQSNEKRSSVINRVKEKLLNNFYKLSPEKKREFVAVLPYSESKGIAREYVEDDYMMVYDDNWELLKEGFLKNDFRHGLWKEYYPDTGDLYEKSIFERGVLSESIAFYKKSEELLFVRKLTSNNIYETQTYHPNKNIKSNGKMLIEEYGKFKRIGTWSLYNENGKLYRLLSNDDNEVTVIDFYENGKKSTETILKLDQIQGIRNLYYKNGQLRQAIEYKTITDKKGSRTSINRGVVAFDKEGNLIDDGNLIDGNGTVIIYNEEGNISEIVTYKENKLKSLLLNPKKIQKAYQKFRKKDPYEPKTDFDINNHTTYDLKPLPISETLQEEVLSAFEKIPSAKPPKKIIKATINNNDTEPEVNNTKKKDNKLESIDKLDGIKIGEDEKITEILSSFYTEYNVIKESPNLITYFKPNGEFYRVHNSSKSKSYLDIDKNFENYTTELNNLREQSELYIKLFNSINKGYTSRLKPNNLYSKDPFKAFFSDHLAVAIQNNYYDEDTLNNKHYFEDLRDTYDNTKTPTITISTGNWIVENNTIKLISSKKSIVFPAQLSVLEYRGKKSAFFCSKLENPPFKTLSTDAYGIGISKNYRHLIFNKTQSKLIWAIQSQETTTNNVLGVEEILISKSISSNGILENNSKEIFEKIIMVNNFNDEISIFSDQKILNDFFQIK